VSKQTKRSISQIELIGVIAGALTKHGHADAEPRIVNVIIAAANSILAELERKPVVAVEGMGLTAWLASDDKGISSIYMSRVFMGMPVLHTARYPIDPSDFGRCYRLMKAAPEVAAVLDLLATGHGDVWTEYVKRWPEMTLLWEQESPQGTCPKLYAVMQDIQVKAGGR